MNDIGINAENFNPKIYYSLKRKSDGTYKPDYHCHDFISMIYVLSGGCAYNISNVRYPVRKGDMIICNPGVYHCKIIDPGEEILEMHIGLGNINVDGLPPNHLIGASCTPVFSLTEYEQEILKCSSSIFFEQENNRPGSVLMLKIHVMELIVLFLKATRTDAGPAEASSVMFESSDKASIVSTLISYINENYMRQLSLDSISKSIYLSPAYVSKVFKEETGESPINYLIKVRLSKARELLLGGRMSIKAAAKTVGYDDAYHFSKLFKKYYSMPPSKLKK